MRRLNIVQIVFQNEIIIFRASNRSKKPPIVPHTDESVRIRDD